MRLKLGCIVWIVLVVLIVTACQPTASPSPAATNTPLSPAKPSATPLPPTATPLPPTATHTPVPPTATPVPPTATPTPTSVPPTPTPIPALPAEPQTIQFAASDGQELQGTYYPAAVQEAPVVVLMHWVMSDQSDWTEIAFWMQNRELGGQTANPQNLPWHDPSWFPPFQEEQTVAVFTFSFRGCTPDGCAEWAPEQWLLDAQAAMLAAGQLEGIDPQRIVTAGASIGADGAVDGCAWLNEQQNGARCLGAFSLSPGGYFDVPYADAVQVLQSAQPPAPAWCLYAEQDGGSATACQSAAGDAYRTVSFAGGPHGMALIAPTIEPKTLELFLEWLATSLGL